MAFDNTYDPEDIAPVATDIIASMGVEVLPFISIFVVLWIFGYLVTKVKDIRV